MVTPSPWLAPAGLAGGAFRSDKDLVKLQLQLREPDERQVLHSLAARRSPMDVQLAEVLAERGSTGIWRDYAREYRMVAGPLRGWVGTGLLFATLGATKLRTQLLKRKFDRPRPFQVDPGLQPVGGLPKDASFPSGHTSSAYAGATVMSALWPMRAREYFGAAKLVGASRMVAGVHYPSDVVIGAKVGMTTAAAVLRALS